MNDSQENLSERAKAWGKAGWLTGDEMSDRSQTCWALDEEDAARFSLAGDRGEIREEEK